MKFLRRYYPKLRGRKQFKSDRQYKTYMIRLTKMLGIEEYKLFNCCNRDLHQWRFNLIDSPAKTESERHYQDCMLTALQAFQMFFKFLNGDIVIANHIH